jgi:hypothetical protein
MRPAGVLLLLGFLICTVGRAQNYHAIEGSPFAGSIGIANNPASILDARDPWDLTILSAQVKNTTNVVTFHNVSLLSYPDTGTYTFTNGNIRRYAAFNTNVHLLNLRLAIGRKQAIAFGANLCGYGMAKSQAFNYNDTITNMNQFFSINGNNTTYNANMVTSTWIELFATYSRTLLDDESGRLNAGLTVKATRGISGAFAQLKNGTVDRTVSGNLTYYLLNAGSARYGYSSNYDKWYNYNSTSSNLKSMVNDSRAGASMDLGFEYLVKSQVVTSYVDGDTYYDYDWKIGVSLLDVGANVYKYGSQSRTASDPKSDISDSLLNAKFDNVSRLAQFNDSLATIVNNISPLYGSFRVWNPTRLVINIDRPLGDQYSVNANLSLNLTGSNNGKQLFAKDFTLCSLTPRWETKNLGAYLPLQVTTEGKVWIGGALKAGPVLLGLHNWANVFSKNSMQNGGFYLAIVIHPGKGFLQKEDKQYTCPKN